MQHMPVLGGHRYASDDASGGVENDFIAYNEDVAGSNPAAGRKVCLAQSGRAPFVLACSPVVYFQVA